MTTGAEQLSKCQSGNNYYSGNDHLILGSISIKNGIKEHFYYI